MKRITECCILYIAIAVRGVTFAQKKIMIGMTALMLLNLSKESNNLLHYLTFTKKADRKSSLLKKISFILDVFDEYS